MAYTIINFKTKKALREAVQDWNEYEQVKKKLAGNSWPCPAMAQAERSGNMPQPVRCYQPGLGPSLYRFSGTVTIEGPHYPEPHRWYALARLVAGVVVSVR